MGGSHHGAASGLLGPFQELKAFGVRKGLELPPPGQQGEAAELDHDAAQIGKRASRQANDFLVALLAEGRR